MKTGDFLPLEAFAAVKRFSSRVIRPMQELGTSANVVALPATLTFGGVVVLDRSATQTLIIRNDGNVPARVSSIKTSLGAVFHVSYPSLLTPLEPDGILQILVSFVPAEKINYDEVLTVTLSNGKSYEIRLLGSGSTDGGSGGNTVIPVISISSGVIEYIDDGVVLDNTIMSLSSTAFTLSAVTAGVAATIGTLTLTNTGSTSATISAITYTGSGLSFDPTLPQVVAAGGSVAIDLNLLATESGAVSETMTIIYGDSSAATVTVSGTVDDPTVSVNYLTNLSTLGNQIINSDGDTVRLKTCSWAGSETTNYIPGGIWEVSYKDLIAAIADMGFNCVRIPFSGDWANNNTTVAGINTDFVDNMDFVVSGSYATNNLVTVTPYEAMATIITALGEAGLSVVLDYHQIRAGNDRLGSSVADQTEAAFIAQWQAVATAFKDFDNIIGVDIYNEPYNISWATWKGYAQNAAEAILAIQPNWLMIVEGVFTSNDATTYWYGGNLKDVATDPVVLSVNNKLVYSPHEYGQSVAQGLDWLAYSGSVPTNWPTSLYAKWDEYWGYIYYNNIAPLWIGEFGGKFGLDGSGNNNGDSYQDYEKVWLATLITYLNGDQNGDGNSDISGTDQGISYSFWEFNPNSADTGGLLMDDWVTYQTTKLNLIADLL